MAEGGGGDGHRGEEFEMEEHPLLCDVVERDERVMREWQSMGGGC